MKFALAIISINIVNVGRPSISHNDWRVPEVVRVGTSTPTNRRHGGGTIWAEAVRPGAGNSLVMRGR